MKARNKMNIQFLPHSNRKAFVIYEDDGTATLVSYETAVLKRSKNGQLVRLWDSWSATTGRYISAFCGLKKADYERLPME